MNTELVNIQRKIERYQMPFSLLPSRTDTRPNKHAHLEACLESWMNGVSVIDDIVRQIYE